MRNKFYHNLNIALVITVSMFLLSGCKKSEEVLFTTAEPVTDIDNNTYSAIKIGTQIWMADNLKTTKYNNGTSIPAVKVSTAWFNRSTPAYCWYNNDSSTYCATYGGLYNWYAVNTGKLCPAGWHVPTDSDWLTLIGDLGGISVAGGKMKEIGISHWIEKNEGASNESGFTGLPAGTRTYPSDFKNLGMGTVWWSSTEVFITWDQPNPGSAYCGYVYTLTNISVKCQVGYSYENSGYSVRCIKNN